MNFWLRVTVAVVEEKSSCVERDDAEMSIRPPYLDCRWNVLMDEQFSVRNRGSPLHQSHEDAAQSVLIWEAAVFPLLSCLRRLELRFVSPCVRPLQQRNNGRRAEF